MTRSRDGKFRPKTLEESIQRAFTQMFLLNRGACEGFSVPNERASKSETIRLKGMGLRKGVADWCVMWQDNGLRVLWIEFKAEKGRQTSEQAAFGEAMQAIGADYVVCRSWEQAWFHLQKRGAPVARVLEDKSTPVMVPNPRLAA